MTSWGAMTSAKQASASAKAATHSSRVFVAHASIELLIDAHLTFQPQHLEQLGIELRFNGADRDKFVVGGAVDVVPVRAAVEPVRAALRRPSLGGAKGLRHGGEVRSTVNNRCVDDGSLPCYLGLMQTGEHPRNEVVDRDGLEIPFALIIKAEGSELTSDDIISWVAQQGAPYKKIRGVEFVTELPKTAAGKNRRGEIRKMAADMV